MPSENILIYIIIVGFLKKTKVSTGGQATKTAKNRKMIIARLH